MAEAAWPAMRKKKFTAITEEEHERIVAKEGNTERRLYYQMLWETGGSQTDIAGLSRHQIDLERGVIQFTRRKLMGKDGGNSFLRIGPRLSALLAQLPQSGDLFPTLKLEEAKHRSAEFRRRCRTLKIQGRTLHSYRYSWAQRGAGSRNAGARSHDPSGAQIAGHPCGLRRWRPCCRASAGVLSGGEGEEDHSVRAGLK